MDADLLLMIFYMCLMGAAMGTFSGLIPGIHVNTLAMLLLTFSVPLLDAVSGFVPEGTAPLMLACCVMSAAVVHAAVSFVPSAFIGIPDTDSVMSVLPAHRMVLDGEGMIAVRCAAIGSLVGAFTSVVLAVPLYLLLQNGLGDYLDSITVGVLVIVLSMMVLGEEGPYRPLAAAVIAASGIAGVVCMTDLLPMENPLGMEPETMFPLLTGLFGIPSLIWHSGVPIPFQYDTEQHPVSPLPGIKGVLTGGLTGWFPGITSTAGAMVAGRIFGNNGPREFISMVASIGTASTVFAFITLSLTGKERSGTMSVINSLVGDADLSLGSEVFLSMMAAICMASVIAYFVTVVSGRWMGSVAGNIDTRRFNRAVLVLMVVLTYVFCGYWGLVILAACTLIGMVPLLFGLHRISLTGCLMVPVLLFRLGVL